jgi:hypothetical protein
VEEPAASVGSRSISWKSIVERVRDLEAVRPYNRMFSDSIEYEINCVLLELEAERLLLIISDTMIETEVQKQIVELKRYLIEQYGRALIWADWLKQQGLEEEKLHAYLSRAARIILLKRMLVNAAETRCDSAKLKDRQNEFLAFADVDDRRFKRWVEDVKKTGRYPIELNPALKND